MSGVEITDAQVDAAFESMARPLPSSKPGAKWENPRERMRHTLSAALSVAPVSLSVDAVLPADGERRSELIDRAHGRASYWKRSEISTFYDTLRWAAAGSPAGPASDAANDAPPTEPSCHTASPTCQRCGGTREVPAPGGHERPVGYGTMQCPDCRVSASPVGPGPEAGEVVVRFPLDQIDALWEHLQDSRTGERDDWTAEDNARCSRAHSTIGDAINAQTRTCPSCNGDRSTCDDDEGAQPCERCGQLGIVLAVSPVERTGDETDLSFAAAVEAVASRAGLSTGQREAVADLVTDIVDEVLALPGPVERTEGDCPFPGRCVWCRADSVERTGDNEPVAWREVYPGGGVILHEEKPPPSDALVEPLYRVERTEGDETAAEKIERAADLVASAQNEMVRVGQREWRSSLTVEPYAEMVVAMCALLRAAPALHELSPVGGSSESEGTER
jgi:hypothetical protein